jgi:hypothetical protein
MSASSAVGVLAASAVLVTRVGGPVAEVATGLSLWVVIPEVFAVE